MDQTTTNQLEKILALADSTHEGEAMGAVRKARQIMLRDGLSFGDLARVASSGRTKARPFSFFSGNQLHLETQLVQLRQKLDDTQKELQTQSEQAAFWRQKAVELEQELGRQRADAKRWRQLAREAVEKLLRFGQPVKAEIAGK